METPTPLNRQQLYEKVWAEPLRNIAREYGLSDVGLKKLCLRHDIPTPGGGSPWAFALLSRIEHVPFSNERTIGSLMREK